MCRMVNMKNPRGELIPYCSTCGKMFVDGLDKIVCPKSEDTNATDQNG